MQTTEVALPLAGVVIVDARADVSLQTLTCSSGCPHDLQSFKCTYQG